MNKKHLRRLDSVWVERPIWFLTICTVGRKKVLNDPKVAEILICEWREMKNRHGWCVGNYVIMPDHVHFFCSAEDNAKPLSISTGKWKEWTSKLIMRELGASKPVWQKEFFDHLIRSDESYSEKWDYVFNNPVRAGLVKNSEDWEYWGEIYPL